MFSKYNMQLSTIKSNLATIDYLLYIYIYNLGLPPLDGVVCQISGIFI